MHEYVTQLAGWLPAIILPTATLLQLITMIRGKTAQGVNLVTWILFLIANLGLYIYTDKLLEVQSILGLFVTAVLDLLIIISILVFNSQAKKSS